MNDLIIEVFGTDTSHDPAWVYDRPRGVGYYLFMCFSTPFFANTSAGEVAGKPGDCLILAPNFPDRHGTVPGEKEGFRNDWIHANGRTVPRLIERFKLPVNTIFFTGDAKLLAPFLHSIQEEQQNRAPYWETAVRQQFELMLMSLARAREMAVHAETLTPAERLWLSNFQDFRTRLMSRLDRTWRIEDMAEEFHLSPNRFCALYRKFFKVSPVENLLRMRIERAKQLLAGSAMPVGEVATACGFTNVFYFSRLFKQRVGCPPSAFVRNQSRPAR